MVVDAGIGRNVAADGKTMDVIGHTLAELRARTGRRVAVIGHSRGGQQARVAAVRQPDDVAL